MMNPHIKMTVNEDSLSGITADTLPKARRDTYWRIASTDLHPKTVRVSLLDVHTGREVAGAYMALDMYPDPQSLQEKAGSVVRLYDQLTADAVPG